MGGEVGGGSEGVDLRVSFVRKRTLRVKTRGARRRAHCQAYCQEPLAKSMDALSEDRDGAGEAHAAALASDNVGGALLPVLSASATSDAAPAAAASSAALSSASEVNAALDEISPTFCAACGKECGHAYQLRVHLSSKAHRDTIARLERERVHREGGKLQPVKPVK